MRGHRAVRAVHAPRLAHTSWRAARDGAPRRAQRGDPDRREDRCRRRRLVPVMDTSVKVACVQVEPVIFERDATIEKMAAVCAEAAAEGAQLIVFPETFV